MGIHIYADLSGEGDLAAVDSGVIFYRRVFVTETGSAHPIEGGTAERWLGIGWTAPYETILEEYAQGPAGQYFTNRQWVEFLAEGFWDGRQGDDIAGYNGLHYHFGPGVVATVVVFER